ncbi:MAG TPA: cysteine desulfurase-like protein [Actinomycetota bacterium]|nr:cysteine desulfurase-like protein [Actinomycetota bacterium]
MDVPDLSPLRARFPALARRGPDGRPFAFLDAPGGTQVPDVVIEATASYLRSSNANLGGAFPTSEETERVVQEARRAGADLLGGDPGEIVFGPNATTLLFHLSRSIGRELRPGDEVVVTRLDHDANVAPWLLAAEQAGAAVRWVDVREEDGTIDEASFATALSDRTRVVAFTLASNAVGTIPPAGDLAGLARAAGAVVVCDGVHLAQHRAIDVRALGADVVVCSPYKVFGPHLGLLWARRELLERWTPARVRPAPDHPPARWETGTQDHEALAGWVAALGYLAEVGRTYGAPSRPDRRAAVVAAFEAIAAYESALAERFLAGLAELPSVRLFGIREPARLAERTPTFALRVGTRHPREVAEALGRRGVFVWDGNYYALALMERLGLEATGGAVRVGFCHYTTVEEVDRVLAELDRVASGG